jgi:transposase
MMKPNRPTVSKGGTYPLEFREEAVKYWLSSGQTLKDVAADLGVSPECLRAWRRQIESSPSTDNADEVVQSSSGFTSSPGELALAREVGQLRRDLDAMTRQRDILKKAISIFSEDKSMSGGTK